MKKIIFGKNYIQKFGANVSISGWDGESDVGSNTSYINGNVTISTNGSTYNNEGSAYFQVNGGPAQYFSIGQNSSKTFSYRLGPYYHNPDGTLGNQTVSVYVRITNSTSTSGSISVGMNTIPRYFTREPKITLQTQNTTNCVIKWETSETCNWIRYKLDGSSSHVDVFSGSGTSGTFTIPNLESNTSHKVYVEARRQDSGLWSNSNTLNFSTSSKTGKIRINGEEKEATPYVRINGEWKVAVPFTRNNNEWKRGK